MRAKNIQTISQVGGSSGELLINRLNFLISAAQHRKKSTNIEVPMNTSESESLNRAESPLNSFDTFYPSRSSSLILLEDSRSDPIADTDGDTGSVAASSFIAPSTKRKRKAEVELETIIETQNKKLEALETMLSNHATDDLSSFFASMEGVTRKLPRYLQIQIKRGLSALVFDAEEENERGVLSLVNVQENDNPNSIESKRSLIHLIENTS